MPIIVPTPKKTTAEIAAFLATLDKDFPPKLRDQITHAFGALATTFSDVIVKDLTALGQLKPGDGHLEFAAAMNDAVKFGFGAHLVAELIELLVPLKNMGFGQVAALMAEFSGFRELVAAYHGPVVHYAVRVPSQAEYAAKFRSRPPSERDAAEWAARGVLGDTDLANAIAWSGLMPEYETALKEAGHRPVPPFLLARAAAIGAIPQAELNNALVFAGFRSQDIDMLEKAYAALALRPYQVAYLTAAERSVELGTDTPASLTRAMNDMGLNPEIQNWVQLTVAERKVQQLAELYRKSVSESYKYGTLADDQYIPALEAVGIDAQDAQAHYAIDSIAKNGKILQAAIRAEEKLARQQKSAAMHAAVAEYHAGLFDDAALEAALLTAGIDPTIAAFAVVINSAKRHGPLTFVFGVELSRADALVLREQVSALGKQATARLISPAEAQAQLTTWNIPLANQNALLAIWYATTTPPARVGIKLPP